MGNIKGSHHCYIGNLSKIPGWNKTHLTGCIGEIIGFHRRLTDEEIVYIHEYLMIKWVYLFTTTKVIPFMSGDVGQLWANLGK